MVDVKAAIARLGLGAISPRSDAESQIEYLAWFRFPVTWTYVSGPVPEFESVAAAKPLPATSSLTLAPIMPVPALRSPIVPDVKADDDTPPTGSAVRWEMMVPKMTRPPARPVASLNAATAPALAAPPKAAFVPAPAISPTAPVSAKPAAPTAPIQFVTPTFLLHTPEDQFVARYWPQIVYVAITIMAVGCLIWGLSSPSPAARSAASSAVNTASWSHQPVSPSGRSVTLYEPSRSESDYRMEFSWVPDAAGVGWVFRTRDGNNYYAARLSSSANGSGERPGSRNILVFWKARKTRTREK